MTFYIITSWIAMSLIAGILFISWLIKFYVATLHDVEDFELDDADESNLRPLLGVVHPSNKNLL